MEFSHSQSELAAAQAQIAADPNSADNWNRAAIACLKRNDLPQAVDYITQAIKLEPDQPLHYSNRGRLLFALERLPEALADYTTAIELAPSAELYSSRSVVNIALGKNAAALCDLNDAYDLEPTVSNLLNRVAFFSNQGMATDALHNLNQVIELEPDQPNHRLARANLAFALARTYPDLYRLGLADIEAAIEQDQTGVLQPTLAELANHLEQYLPGSPNPDVSRRLIELIRSKNNP